MTTLHNKNGDAITQDFVSGKFDATRVKEIIADDITPLPTGYPKLWFNVYAHKVFITNLTGVTLREYDI
jgi:hypothetical protein